MSEQGIRDLNGLLQLARGGNGAAWGELLEQYRTYLTLLAQHQIGRRLSAKSDASDLVQATFLQAYRRLDQFRGGTEAELAGWLREILASRLAKLVRHYYGTQSRDVRLERQMEEPEQSSRVVDPALVAPQSSPSGRAAHRELAVHLARALEALPTQYREVLILRHLEGHSFPEIALRMGRTVDSVEKLWTRALPRLRGALGMIQ